MSSNRIISRISRSHVNVFSALLIVQGLAKLAAFNNGILNLVSVPSLFVSAILSVPVRILSFIFWSSDNTFLVRSYESLDGLTFVGNIVTALFWAIVLVSVKKAYRRLRKRK